MKIKSIEIEKIRKIEHLKLKTENPLSFFQIQNGYGKTTILSLIRHIFSGNRLHTDEIMEYKYHGVENIDDSEGKFAVELEIDNEPIKITLKLYFDKDLPDSRFFTSSVNNKGESIGWKPTLEFRNRFQNKNTLIELFIFNGELANQLNRAQGKNIVYSSIKQVTNLHHLSALLETGSDEKNEISGMIYKVWKTALEDNDIRSKKASNGYSKLVNLIDFVRLHIEKLVKEESELQSDQANLVDEIEEYKTKLRKFIGTKSEDREKLDNLQEEAECAMSELKTFSQKILFNLFDPVATINRIPKIRDFYASIERRKIPKSIGKSFFKQIMESKICICGSTIEEDNLAYLEKHKDDFLGDDILYLVISMQSSLISIDKLEDPLKLKKSLQEHIINYFNKQETFEKFEKELIHKYEDQEHLDKIIEERDKKVEKLEKIKNRLSVLTTKTPAIIEAENLSKNAFREPNKPYRDVQKLELCENIYTLENVLAIFIKELDKYEKAREIERGYQILHETLKYSLERVLEDIVSEIEIKTNEYFSKLHAIGGDHITGKHTIKIENGVKIYNPKGELMKEANAAAQLGAAYSFILSMYTIGNIDVPLVIDSPVTGFGLGVSNNFAEVILQNEFSQVIGLITSMEKIGLKKFLNGSSDVYRATIKRENETVDGKNASGPLVLDEDLEFFESYEVEEDKE